MSAVNQSVKSNEFFTSTYELSEAILRDTDPVEETMNRAPNRIYGALLGFVSIGPLQGLLLADAWADNKKIRMIDQHLAKLSNADESGVEKQIYTEIAEYTKSAQIIKLFSATMGAIAAIRYNYFETYDLLTAGCGTACLVGFGLSVLHYYAEGPAMKERHKQMVFGQTTLSL